MCREPVGDGAKRVRIFEDVIAIEFYTLLRLYSKGTRRKVSFNMTPLTKVAITTRRIIRWGVFFAIFLIVGKILFDMGYGIYIRVSLHPRPHPPFLSADSRNFPSPNRRRFLSAIPLKPRRAGFPRLGHR